MRIKKLFVSLSFSVLFSVSILSGQVRIHFNDVKILKNGDIKAEVVAQNVGSRTRFGVSYGIDFYGRNHIESSSPINSWDSDIFNFHIYYKDILRGRYVMKTPSSITIRTIFGTITEMDQHTYEMQSTGSAGELWDIYFTNIPLKSENVGIVILSDSYTIGDMPLAEEARIEINQKVSNLIEEGNKLADENDFVNAISNYKQTLQFVDDTKTIILSEKIDSCYYQIAEKATLDGNYLSANENYSLCLDYDVSNSFDRKSITENIATGYFKIAEKEFFNGNYDTAIENYVLCQDMDISYIEKIKQNYAESVFQIAASYENSDHIKSSELYKEAIKIDKDFYKKVDVKFKSIRKNQFVNIISSSIPGLQQYCRKQKNYLYISAGFLSFSGLAIYYSISADQYYKEYKKATTTWKANSLYDETIHFSLKAETFRS
nr:tetratricopeptide repeat protein [Bacteroidota bacterium]